VHAHRFSDLGQGDLPDPPLGPQLARGIEDRRFSQVLRLGAARVVPGRLLALASTKTRPRKLSTRAALRPERTDCTTQPVAAGAALAPEGTAALRCPTWQRSSFDEGQEHLVGLVPWMRRDFGSCPDGR